MYKSCSCMWRKCHLQKKKMKKEISAYWVFSDCFLIVCTCVHVHTSPHKPCTCSNNLVAVSELTPQQIYMLHSRACNSGLLLVCHWNSTPVHYDACAAGRTMWILFSDIQFLFWCMLLENFSLWQLFCFLWIFLAFCGFFCSSFTSLESMRTAQEKMIETRHHPCTVSSL